MGYNESGESFSGKTNINSYTEENIRYTEVLCLKMGSARVYIIYYYGFILLYADWSNIID